MGFPSRLSFPQCSLACSRALLCDPAYQGAVEYWSPGGQLRILSSSHFRLANKMEISFGCVNGFYYSTFSFAIMVVVLGTDSRDQEQTDVSFQYHC